MEDKLKILLCEDDENLGMLLREYLQAKGYMAELCPDGDAGYKAFMKTKFDICVLDVMMPKKDGFTLAQEIRQSNPDMPIIFLTAKTLKEDILEGFKLGADEYISKPFSPRILVARVESLLKRNHLLKGKTVTAGGIEVNREARTVTANGKEVDLTFKEFELLNYFIDNPSIALSRDKILNNVWDFDYFGDVRTVDTHVKKLRSKLLDCGAYIKTVRGLGYKFETEETDEEQD